MLSERKPLIQQGWLRALLYAIAIVLIGFAAQFGAAFILDNIKIESGIEIIDKLQNFIVTYITISITIFLVTFLFRKLIDRKTFASLGYQWKGYKNEAMLGFFTGPALLGIGTIILVLTGYLTFIGITFTPDSLSIELLIMLLVAFTEETLFRGYLLNNLLQSMNKWLALLITAVLFGLFHAGNPDVNIISLINVFIAGLLLGVNYIYTKNLWFGILFHFAWNFFQGPILGYEVSGLELQSLFQQSISGSELFTGGKFGFEGSLLCSILIALAVAFFTYLFSIMYKTVAAPSND